VPVIPVRETEAWALADVDALREVLGTTRTADQLGLSMRALRALEENNDPKALLRQAMAASSARQRRRQPTIPAGLGNNVSLGRLRDLPAYTRFEAAVQAALRQIWNIRA
jgi:hypothetical protein